MFHATRDNLFISSPSRIRSRVTPFCYFVGVLGTEKPPPRVSSLPLFFNFTPSSSVMGVVSEQFFCLYGSGSPSLENLVFGLLFALTNVGPSPLWEPTFSRFPGLDSVGDHLVAAEPSTPKKSGSPSCSRRGSLVPELDDTTCLSLPYNNSLEVIPLGIRYSQLVATGHREAVYLGAPQVLQSKWRSLLPLLVVPWIVSR